MIVRIILSSPLDSKSARQGDPIEATLKDDFIMGGKLYASKGAKVSGHLVENFTARTLSHAVVSNNRRFHSAATLAIQFDQISDGKNSCIPITGLLSQQTVSTSEPNTFGREIKVDGQGHVIKAEAVLSPMRQNIYNAIKIFTFVPLPAGLVLNLTAEPVAMVVAGAADPSFVFGKPIDHKVEHRRLKGMAYGLLTSLPGAWLVSSIIFKGDQVVLKPGDELALDLCLKKEEPMLPTKSYTVADVRGAVLSTGAPLPGLDEGSSADDGFIVQSPKYDHSLEYAHPGVPNALLIYPVNGGQRLLPSSEVDRYQGRRLFPSVSAKSSPI